MLDLRADSIIYQAQGYLVELIDSLITNKRLGKALNKEWDKADLILSYLEAWEERLKLEDITQMNYVLECLISLCKLNEFPSAPVITGLTPPSILYGLPGPPGTSITGPQGPTGLATDFQVTSSVTTVVDSFSVTDAKSARWDYTVIEVGGAQRSGFIIGTWSSTGSAVELTGDISTSDIIGATTGIEFDIQYSAGSIQLLAVITSGNWNIVGSRYFIPNNGNGSGPISNVLPNGQVFIGNSLNTAQARTLSGAITITNTGVATLGSGVIVDSNINASAGITLSKLAPVTANKLLLSNGAGVIIASSITDTEASHLSGASSNLQVQISARLIDPTTTIGDMICRNASNVISRIPVGSAGQVLTVSGGVPTWQNAPGGISGLTTTYLPKASSATTLNDSIISQSGSAINIAGTLEVFSGIRTQTTGPYLKTQVIDINDWDMVASSTKNISFSMARNKIRAVFVTIRDDSDTNSYTIVEHDTAATASMVLEAEFYIGPTQVFLRRKQGGAYDNTSFDSTGYNRGWVTIIYEA